MRERRCERTGLNGRFFCAGEQEKFSLGKWGEAWYNFADKMRQGAERRRQMEGKKRRFPWRAARWERMLLTAVATVLSGEVFFNLGNDNFRISGAVVLFPVLLLTLLQDSRTPLTGVLTGVCLLLVRSAIDCPSCGGPSGCATGCPTL